MLILFVAMMNDTPERNIGFLIHDVARLMRTAFDRRMYPLGLTRSQWWVLAHLRRRDGVSQTELAEELDLGKVTLGGLIDRLEANGWVERKPDAKDRRAKRIFLADKSEGVIAHMTRASADLIHDVTEGLSEREFNQMLDILTEFKERLLVINAHGFINGAMEDLDAVI